MTTHSYKSVKLGEGSGAATPPYTENITAAGSWTLNGSYYEITIPTGTHNQGTALLVAVYETVSGDFEQIETSVTITSSGNVTIAVTSTPDLRFDGKIIIKGE